MLAMTEKLCVDDTCGMAVRVAFGDPACLRGQGVQCQDCNRCFEFPWIQWQGESNPASGVPSALRSWLEKQKRVFDVVEYARCGDLEATHTLCEILGKELKPWIERKLRVQCPDRACAVQGVILRVRQKITQLEQTEKFFGWLRRVVLNVSKDSWVPTVARSKKPEIRPREIGTKTTLVDGKPHIVKVFESCPSAPSRQPLCEPLTDSIIAGWSDDNRPNYVLKSDVRNALEKIPIRWARAILLMDVEELSGAEVGAVLGCSEQRVYRIVQLAKARLRLLLKSYAPNGDTNSGRRSYKSRQLAAVKYTIRSHVPPKRCWVVIRVRIQAFRQQPDL